jgi:hypothetical protein
MNRSPFASRACWCIGVWVLGYVRIWFGDPAHPAAADRSLVFTAVWTCVLLAYLCIMYLQPFKPAGADYMVLVGCLLVIAWEVHWPLAAFPNTPPSRVSGPVAVARLFSLWGESRRFWAQSTADAT